MPSDVWQLNFRYALVVKACALEEDFSDFVEGDQTEVIYFFCFGVLFWSKSWQKGSSPTYPKVPTYYACVQNLKMKL